MRMRALIATTPLVGLVGLPNTHSLGSTLTACCTLIHIPRSVWQAIHNSPGRARMNQNDCIIRSPVPRWEQPRVMLGKRS